MSELTPKINTDSINTIQTQIFRKTSSNPYFATGSTISSVVTDMDHHPYTRWFRGVYYYPEPIIMEREAGFRSLRNSCYDINIPPKKDEEPSHCYEGPCSTTYPCYPKYLAKYSDRQALDLQINNSCIPQYR